MLLASLEDSLLTQSSQVQAAEDILDKYRNIKRTSPSNGATGGAYDGTGGKSLHVKTIKHIALNVLSNMWTCYQSFVGRTGCLNPCRTFPQMTFRTLPARQPSSRTQSSLSGQYPFGVEIVFLFLFLFFSFFSHQILCWFNFFWCCFFKWCEKEVAVGLMLSWLCGVANHDSRYHTEWTARSHGIWRWARSHLTEL